jgi:TolB-like protein/Tfp pilus assembly protein PilF
MKRRLTAILAADVVSYSHLMDSDEMATIQALKECESTIIEPSVESNNGRIFKRLGDGFLVEFSSAVDCLKCALTWRDLTNDSSHQLRFRFGVNLAEVISEEGDLFGHGVNVASRLESVAEPGEIYISQEVLAQVENKLEAEFKDLGHYQLKNILKPVQVFQVFTPEDSGVSGKTKEKGAGPDLKKYRSVGTMPAAGHNSIAILPFDNHSGSDEYNHLMTGFVEDLIVDLSRYSGLEIISSYTANLLGDGDVDLFEAAEEISIRYLVKGTIRFGADTMRIHTQLLNTSTRKVLWAERYDTPVESFFQVQDHIVEQIVCAIQTEVDHDLLSVARKKTTTSLEVYDCWLRGMSRLSSGTLKADQEARDFFNQALAMDPDYARAYAGLSLSHFNEWSCQLWELYEESAHYAFKYASRAAQLDDTDHVVQMILGRVYMFKRQFEQAEFHIDRSLYLNQSDGDNLIQLATCLAFLGRITDAERLVDKALKLNPYRNLWYYQYGSFVYFVKKDYQQSIDMALKRQLTKVWVDLPAYIGAAYAYLGEQSQARKYMEVFVSNFQSSITRGRTPTPEEMIDWVKMANPFRYESDMAHIVEGLKRAGIDAADRGPVVSPRAAERTSKTAVSIFKKEQAIWRIQFEGEELTLTNMKGLVDIFRLLQSPETEIHCTELMGSESSMDEASLVLDKKAVSSYRKRIKDLEEDISEAEEQNDLARTRRLKTEYDQLVEHLTQALGAGGRIRKLKSPSERARVAVTMRIKKAIKRIADHHPSLGKHLANSIKTGVFCTYSPEEHRQWITH